MKTYMKHPFTLGFRVPQLRVVTHMGFVRLSLTRAWKFLPWSE